MPKKLTLEYVSDFINCTGHELKSTEYLSNKQLLDIKCRKCNEIYKQTFDRFRNGYYHKYCEKEPFGGYGNPGSIKYIKPTKLKPITCPICKLEFQPKRSETIYCSLVCTRLLEQTPAYKQNAKKNGHKGGLVSATKQSRRSKNEICFAEYCESYFGKENVSTNEPFFDGWDADVILHGQKIAILWNGAWHYKQISKTQSLKQVKARDKVKNAIIHKYGYTPYVIKDMDKYNPDFVQQEFEIFLLMRMEID